MFKVSFKGDFKEVREYNGKAVVVILTGKMKLPDWYENIHQDIIWWVFTESGVEFHDNEDGVARIVARGRAVCAEGDTYDLETGQRIAESRAKIRIYKFLCTLCKKVMKYYYGIMYGNAAFGVIRESHTEEPRDCLHFTRRKYRELWIKESHHLGKLLEEAEA